MKQKECSITRIHLLGMSGSGKDTNAIPLKNKYPKISNIVSTGDIFRGANTPKGEFGCYYSILKPHIENTNNGGFIPDDIIVRIVDIETAKRQQKSFSRFIFTGYPRTLAQLEVINKSPQNDIFIFLDCSIENAQIRIKNRYEETIKNKQTIRKDDLPEKFPKRLQSFQEFTLPLIMELQRRGYLITINANATIEQVAHEIQEKVKV